MLLQLRKPEFQHTRLPVVKSHHATCTPVGSGHGSPQTLQQQGSGVLTPDPLRESTLGQLGKAYKKKKRETKPGRSAPPATLGQKQQPRSGVTATKGQLVAGGHRALWGDSHAWPNAARLAASVSAPRCLSAGGHRFKVTMSLLFTDYSGIKGIGHHLHVSA